MSTIDPAESRDLRPASPAPGRTALTIGLLLSAACWFLFGAGLADAAAYPVGQVYLTPDRYPPNDVPGLLWAIFVGVFAACILDVAMHRALARRVGHTAAFGFMFAISLSSVALAIRLLAPEFWVPAPEPGYDVDAAGRTAGQWGIDQWIAWTSHIWAPAVLAITAGLVLLRAVRAKQERARRLERATTVIQTGKRVRGVVTETHHTGVEIMDEPRIRYTIAFTDHLGVKRWVTKTSTFERTRIPRVGDPAVVWFDSDHPEDESSIPVALGSPGDVDGALSAEQPPAP